MNTSDILSCLDIIIKTEFNVMDTAYLFPIFVHVHVILSMKCLQPNKRVIILVEDWPGFAYGYSIHNLLVICKVAFSGLHYNMDRRFNFSTLCYRFFALRKVVHRHAIKRSWLINIFCRYAICKIISEYTPLMWKTK